MTTITRSQLQAAIEAGITSAAGLTGFGTRHAEALWAVGSSATTVARGTYAAVVKPDGERVLCPVSLAFPDFDAEACKWDMQTFSGPYDRVTFEAIGRVPGVRVLCVVEEDEGEAVA